MSFWFLSDGIIKRGFLFIRQMTGKVKCIGCGIYFTKNHKLQTYCHRKCFLNSYKNVRRSREMVKMPTLQMQDNEKWVPVVGYEGFYSVSDMGNVISLDRIILRNGNKHNIQEKILVKCKRRGYYCVMLGKGMIENSKQFDVHRLVAIAFITNPDNKSTVNHKNGIKTDNRVENLEWCTQKENNQHALDIGLRVPLKGEYSPNSKLYDIDILNIRESHSSGESQTSITNRYGLGGGTVSRIISRQSWKHIK